MSVVKLFRPSGGVPLSRPRVGAAATFVSATDSSGLPPGGRNGRVLDVPLCGRSAECIKHLISRNRKPLLAVHLVPLKSQRALPLKTVWSEGTYTRSSAELLDVAGTF